MMIRKLTVALALVALAACVGPAGEDGPAGPQGPQGEQGEPGADGVDGIDGVDLAEPEAAIAAVYPLALSQGRSGSLRVLGYFTEFTADSSVSLGDGIEVTEVSLESATSLRVKLEVATDATLGMRTLTVDSLTYGDPDKGTGILVGPTLTVTPNEFAAGDNFEAIVHTADITIGGRFDVSNCMGVTGLASNRLSAKRIKITGGVALAASLGECSVRLIEGEGTDDERVSIGNVTITDANTTAFNAEGLATGTLNLESPTQYLLLNAGENQVIALRHKKDEEAGQDGTGPVLLVYESGNLLPIFRHEGGDTWVEYYNETERSLLVMVVGQVIPDEGLDFAVEMEQTEVPNLVAGEATTGRVPLASGRASWYRHHVASPSYLRLTLLAEEAADLQIHTWAAAGDRELYDGPGSFSSVVNTGAVVVRITDATRAEEDAMMQFTANLSVTELAGVDEDGNATGNVTPEENSARFLVTVPAGQVLSASASSDAADMSIAAYWLAKPEELVRRGALVEFPSGVEREVLLTVSASALEEAVDFSLSTRFIDPVVLTLGEAAEGSAPEDGAAWFRLDLDSVFAGSAVVVPGNVDHLQTGIVVMGGNASVISGVSGNEAALRLGGSSHFIWIDDMQFVAEEDQSFTLTVDLMDEEAIAALSASEHRCFDWTVLDLSEGDERGTFSVNTTTSGDNNISYMEPGGWGGPTERGVGPEQVIVLALTRPALLDVYLVAEHDTVLFVTNTCGEAEVEFITDGYNDDGVNFSGVRLPNFNSGINNLSLSSPGLYYLIVDGYGADDAGDVAVNVRLRDLP